MTDENALYFIKESKAGGVGRMPTIWSYAITLPLLDIGNSFSDNGRELGFDSAHG
jgi:hypothetical protein